MLSKNSSMSEKFSDTVHCISIDLEKFDNIKYFRLIKYKTFLEILSREFPLLTNSFLLIKTRKYHS